MVTMLDCIRRVSPITEKIVNNRKATINPLLEMLGGRVKEINEIVFVGSGTSSTCAMTSKGFVERASGLKTTVSVPNEFCYDKYAYNTKALYIFTSQSGTSIITRECLRKAKALGCPTVAVTEAPTTPIAKEADVHVDMGCGNEEYGMRTIGYCSSVLTHMLIAMELGLARGALTQGEYDAYIAEALRVPASHKAICDQTIAWFDNNKLQLMQTSTFTIYGADSLWGVALEGALKILETARKISIGYELEEGLHGPTMAYDRHNCVIVLNDGGREDKKSLALGRFAKAEVGNGFVVGSSVLDDTDLKLDIQGGAFRAIEFAPVVEIIAYRMAVDFGYDLTKPMEFKEVKYFQTHDE